MEIDTSELDIDDLSDLLNQAYRDEEDAKEKKEALQKALYQLLEIKGLMEFEKGGFIFKRSSTVKYNFDQEQVEKYLEEKGKRELFIKFEISKTKLTDLIKTNQLTYLEMAEIEKFITKLDSPCLRREKKK